MQAQSIWGRFSLPLGPLPASAGEMPSLLPAEVDEDYGLWLGLIPFAWGCKHLEGQLTLRCAGA